MITFSVSQAELEDIRVGLKLLAIALAFPSKASRQFLTKAFDKPEIEMARFDKRHGEVQALLTRLAPLPLPA